MMFGLPRFHTFRQARSIHAALQGTRWFYPQSHRNSKSCFSIGLTSAETLAISTLSCNSASTSGFVHSLIYWGKGKASQKPEAWNKHCLQLLANKKLLKIPSSNAKPRRAFMQAKRDGCGYANTLWLLDAAILGNILASAPYRSIAQCRKSSRLAAAVFLSAV